MGEESQMGARMSRTDSTGMISSTSRETSGRFPTVGTNSDLPGPELAEAPMPDDKWPVWKTATFIIAYCSLAWSLIGAGIWFMFR